MMLWSSFWAIWLALSGMAFVVITAVVAIKGFADLRDLFRDLISAGNEEKRIV